MQVGSGEHFGWEQPRDAEVIGVWPGAEARNEFAWLKVGLTDSSERLHVMVRRRFGSRAWVAPASGERVDVEAWQLDDRAAAELRAQASVTNKPPWKPPKPLPDLWLWVKG